MRYCCIVGPTAAGKSALAMEIAAKRGLAIVSADSRQIYRHFDIGTGKPTVSERNAVAHYGIDCVDAQERYSAHRWAVEAKGWIAEAIRNEKPPVIVGGTGLYVRALVTPFDSAPTLDPKLRKQLEPWLNSLDREELVRWCMRLDPKRAHLGRTQLLRAIETVLLTGTRLSDHFSDIKSPDTFAGDLDQQHKISGESAGGPENERSIVENARYLLVDPGSILSERIELRVRQMVRDGFFEEVESLMRWVPEDAPAWNACGYRSIREAIVGKISRERAIEQTVIASRQYAKRQRTWFRHQLPANQVTAINPLDSDTFSKALLWWDECWNHASEDQRNQAETGSAFSGHSDSGEDL